MRHLMSESMKFDQKKFFDMYRETYGRGYVQLTWKENYEKMSKILNLNDDLLIHPERVMEPEIAYQIMSHGMCKGLFTGKKLGDYIHDDTCDYKNARRIINALDQWQLIKDYAETFESFLKQSRIAAGS
jgi:predicted chitinase